MNSRDKGKRGELELSRLLRSYGYKCRRGQQYCGASGDADVVGLPGLHIECKRVENLNIKKAMKQSQMDAREGEMPVVIHRKNRNPWLVTMTVDTFNRISSTQHVAQPLITISLNEFLKMYKEYMTEAGGGDEE